jgi:hypothetical protein
MSENKIVFYARYRTEIIECKYLKKLLFCDVVFNIDINQQTVSYMEIGKMKKFKSTRKIFDKTTKFIVLEDTNTHEAHYLSLHFNDKKEVYIVELTNSKDTGYLYFDDSVKKNI